MPPPIPAELLDVCRAVYEAGGPTTPFQSPAWLGHLYNRHTAGMPWLLKLPHGFAPLIREKKGVLGSLRLSGGDYEDILALPGREGLAVDELLASMDRAKGWTTANFRALREEGALLTGWKAKDRSGWTAAVIPHRAHKFVKLPGSWAEYEPVIGKKLAYKLRAAAGRRDKAFTSHVLRRATAETLDADLEALHTLHQARWTKRGESGVFAEEEGWGPFKAASRELLSAGQLWLYTLWLEEKPASALYCLADGRAVYYYIGGIDATQQKHHPGKVLIAQAIKDAIEAGLQEFDFLSGGESYKDDWANAERTVYRLLIGRGLIGKLIVKGFGPINERLRQRKTAREARKAAAWAKPDAGTLEE